MAALERLEEVWTLNSSLMVDPCENTAQSRSVLIFHTCLQPEDWQVVRAILVYCLTVSQDTLLHLRETAHAPYDTGEFENFSVSHQCPCFQSQIRALRCLWGKESF